MEVLVAVLIFGLVMGSVTVVMRSASRSWSAGHGLSEIVQGARLTQNVMLRDLNSLVYRSETEYNQQFRKQMESFADTYAQEFQIEEEEEAYLNLEALESLILERGEEDQLMLEEMVTKPIDLSFRASDGEEFDELTFVRTHVPRFEGEPMTLGLRRIKYYVEEGVLYREEQDPYGYPGGGKFSELGEDTLAAQLAEHFMRADEDEGAPQTGPYEILLPEPLNLAEPIADEIALFNVTCGYFKDGEWIEVPKWDSNARDYRHPPEEELSEEGEEEISELEILRREREEDEGVQATIERVNQKEIPADDLPGYVAIQLGMRLPGGRGRIHSFTFFHALPIGQERDIRELEEDEIPEEPDFSPSELRERRR